MGFLLLQYEYQRANAKVTSLTRTGMQIDNKLTKLTKRITDMEKMFEKQKSKVDNAWSSFNTNATNVLQSAQATAAASTSGAAAQSTVDAAISGITIGNYNLGAFIDTSSIAAAGTAQEILSAVNTVLAQARSVMATLIETVKEGQKEALDCQEEEQMGPIKDKEVDLNADKSLNDSLISLWTERKENAKGRLPENIKDSMAGFGLK